MGVEGVSGVWWMGKWELRNVEKMEDFLEFLDWMGESRNIDGVGSGGCQRVEDTESGSSGGFKRSLGLD